MDIVDSSQSEYDISALHPGDGTRHFSSNILKVEISGPSRSHFNILDLPEIFQSLTKNLTAEEKDEVRDSISTHMIQKQSVIV